jgi:general secretion pathway protein D
MLRRDAGAAAAFLATVVLVGCSAGNVFLEQGRKAQERKDWDTALVDFEKAAQREPDNTEILLHEKYAREHASLFHLERGKRLLKQDRPEDAIGEFQKAVSIDPSNQAAEQELRGLLALQAEAKAQRQKQIQTAIQASEEQGGEKVPELKPLPKEPLVRFYEPSIDSRRAYETLAKLAALNVVFTPDFQPRPVSLDLTNITVGDALQVLALQTHTFWRVVTPNTILVVPDNPANRRDYQQEVLKTVYLSNPLKPADRTAITTALKQILGLQRIIDNPDSNAIVIRDTPEKVAEAVQLIHDLDRGKAEILVDVDVMEADADRVRDLGLSTAQALSFASPFPNGTQAALGFTPKNGVTVGSLTGLPLNQIGKISTSDFSIALPGAVATALLNDSHTRILDNPEVRVTDGETATLKIGSSVPFATGSFLPSYGGTVPTGSTSSGSSSLGLLASTQFQYKDVGVNLTLTPHLMPDGEIELHAKIDISSVGQSYSIGGLNEPSFGQRNIEHDIRLKEGEVNLLGGLIESTVKNTTTGFPGLSDIPGLKYLFSTNEREKIDTEVLVMLTPRIIRLPESYPTEAVSIAAQPAAGSPPAEGQPARLPPPPEPRPPHRPQ